jgi:hypothetical protein
MHGKRGENVAVLDRKQWSKMMKDCKLLNSKFTLQAADILFAQVARQAKAISLDQWLDSLELVVQASGTDIDFVRANIAVASPHVLLQQDTRHVDTNIESNCTEPASKVSDLKSDRGTNRVTMKFTREEINDLQNWNRDNAKFQIFMNTMLAAARARAAASRTRSRKGTSRPMLDANTHFPPNPAAAAMPQTPKQAEQVQEVNDEMLAQVFYSFCAFGKRRGGGATHLEGNQFVKMMKDCRILNKAFNSNAADILFSKLSGKERVIGLGQWMDALRLVGEEANKDEDWVKRKLVCNGVPKSTGTKPESSRFHDDAKAREHIHGRS